jgi:NIMA-interacting peptidyl-prolyl cis-trans isomerase 4
LINGVLGALGWMNRGGMVGPFQDAGKISQIDCIHILLAHVLFFCAAFALQPSTCDKPVLTDPPVTNLACVFLILSNIFSL